MRTPLKTYTFDEFYFSRTGGSEGFLKKICIQKMQTQEGLHDLLLISHLHHRFAQADRRDFLVEALVVDIVEGMQEDSEADHLLVVAEAVVVEELTISVTHDL